jgi:hypothetical protein
VLEPGEAFARPDLEETLGGLPSPQLAAPAERRLELLERRRLGGRELEQLQAP